MRCCLEQVILAQSAFELGTLRQDMAAAESLHEELLLESAKLDNAARIERYARQSLGMVEPAPGTVQYVVADVRIGDSLAQTTVRRGSSGRKADKLGGRNRLGCRRRLRGLALMPPRTQSNRRRPTRASASSASRPRKRRMTRSAKRLIFMFFAFTLSFGAMAARIVVLQVVEAPAYVELASKQREREIIIPARRGAILDRSGEPLAISVDTFMIYTDHIHLVDARKTAEKLSRVLDEDPVDIERLLQPSFEGDQFEFLARQVTPKVARRIRAMELDGIYMKVEPKRYYPGGRLAAHVLGFADIDGKGLEGIERQYESILQGEPGRLTNEQDPTGELELPQAGSSEQRSVPGRSLFLTLDKELQYFTELTLADAARRYHAESGSAIIMRPDTGEILALANVPQFDANEPGEFPTEVRRNRALTDVYEPGSAFKIVTAAAALEKQVVTPRTTFTVPDSFDYSDRTFHDSHPHPTEQMTVSEIIQESSNVGTIQVGLRLGGKRLDRAVKKFGFGTETGLDFPGESSGIVLDRKDWTGPTIATIPIGQGIAVTPMQLVTCVRDACEPRCRGRTEVALRDARRFRKGRAVEPGRYASGRVALYRQEDGKDPSPCGRERHRGRGTDPRLRRSREDRDRAEAASGWWVRRFLGR